jgi:hypothetical protein
MLLVAAAPFVVFAAGFVFVAMAYLANGAMSLSDAKW